MNEETSYTQLTAPVPQQQKVKKKILYNESELLFLSIQSMDSMSVLPMFFFTF